MGTRWTGALIAMVIAIALPVSACARVKPYQRGDLASRVMNPAADPAEAKTDGHVQEYREGSAGGSDVSGGGCGCN